MIKVTIMKKIKTWVGIFKNMGGNTPSRNFPREIFQGRSLMGGNFPGENFSGGSFPDTL